jgi:hypothetical protein
MSFTKLEKELVTRTVCKLEFGFKHAQMSFTKFEKELLTRTAHNLEFGFMQAQKPSTQQVKTKG